jgi:hypothetical protein
VGLIDWEKQGIQRTEEEGITCKVKTLDEREILKCIAFRMWLHGSSEVRVDQNLVR